MIRSLDELDVRRRALFDQGMEMLSANWDEDTAMLWHGEDGQTFHASRDTVFYALGLLLRDRPGDRERVDRCLRKVLECQICADGEVYDGTFRAGLEFREPVRGKLDWQRMSRETMYALDVYHQRLTAAFRRHLQTDDTLRAMLPAIEEQLHKSLLEEFPVVWATYDPNWREFILSTFALILIHFEDRLPAETVAKMEEAARRGIQAAVLRARTGFIPLNTNIRVMHVFLCDWFGVRWQDERLKAHALDYAEQILKEYRRYHSVPEFNSPTYNGVVYTYVGFWQLFGSCERLKELGRELEIGMWQDFAEVYNPAMRNICGPYSRAYELDMTIHTAVPSILYMTGILDALPPLSIESDSNAVLVLTEICIPEAVRPLLTASRGERTAYHRFEELAERGEPGNNHALCTTTGWITDDLMLGAMRDSRNTSYQLHPAVAFWRNSEGSLSTMKLLRRNAMGELAHFHTVYMDFTAEPHRLSGQIRMRAGQDMVPYFEIESPALDEATFTADRWDICGLTVRVRATLTENGRSGPAPFHTERIDEKTLRVCYPAADGTTLDFDMTFDLIGENR